MQVTLDVQPPSPPASITITGWSAPESFPPLPPGAPPPVPAPASAAVAPPVPVVALGLTPAQPAATARAMHHATRAAIPDRTRPILSPGRRSADERCSEGANPAQPAVDVGLP